MLSKAEIEQLIKDDNCNNYFLLNEILAIRDKTEEIEDYEICVNGYISVDVLNENIERENKLKQLETEKQKLIEKLEEDTNRLIPLAEDGDFVAGRKEEAREILSILKK